MKQVEQRAYNEEKSQAFLTFIIKYNGSEGAKTQLQAFLADPEVNINYVEHGGQAPMRIHRLRHVARRNGQDTAGIPPAKGDEVVNKAPNHGRTALYYACKRGHKDAIQMLLDAGATVSPTIINELKTLFPQAIFIPDPNHEGHSVLATNDLITHVTAINERFTPLLKALLRDGTAYKQYALQLAAATYEAAFEKDMQGKSGEKIKIPANDQMRKVFEEQAVKTWKTRIDEKKEPAHVSLFPPPQGRVVSLQEIAARRLGTAIVNGEVMVPEEASEQSIQSATTEKVSNQNHRVKHKRGDSKNHCIMM